MYSRSQYYDISDAAQLVLVHRIMGVITAAVSQNSQLKQNAYPFRLLCSDLAYWTSNPKLGLKLDYSDFFDGRFYRVPQDGMPDFRKSWRPFRYGRYFHNVQILLWSIFLTNDGNRYLPTQNTHCKLWYGEPSNEWFRIGWKEPKELVLAVQGSYGEEVFEPMDWEFWYQILPNANKNANKK